MFLPGFLGSEVGNALAKLSAQDLQSMTVDLPIGLTGTFQNPNINLNMQQAVNNLTQKIVAQQKAELTKKGIDALGNIITGGRTQPKTPDTTATPEAVKKDSIKSPQEKQIQDAARDILGGLLGGKKKPKDTTKVN